jgi:hypothetical protein
MSIAVLYTQNIRSSANMQTESQTTQTERFARCVANSKRVRWDIDKDVIRGRSFDLAHKFLPDGLSEVDQMDFLSRGEKRYLSQIQGRTYANVFGLVERFISAKVLELSRDYWMGDQAALEGLVRFCDEELKHQELFRRIERKIAEVQPGGYSFVHDPDQVARVVLEKSTWAVLMLTLHIELFTQLHYTESIGSDNEQLSPLFKDVFLYHWKEESQHAIMDELELIRHDGAISDESRDKAVNEFIELICAVDAIVCRQAADDSRYFTETCGRPLSGDDKRKLETVLRHAYRWQYILSGAQHPRFLAVLGSFITESQGKRIQSALATLM